MVNRITFFDSISDIKYPKMLVDFFDQFIALKQIVEDRGKISVESSTENSIVFSIIFDNRDDCNRALSNVTTGAVVIYNRPIYVQAQVISETQIKIMLQ